MFRIVLSKKVEYLKNMTMLREKFTQTEQSYQEIEQE